jgi:hypothetical protein
VIAKLYVRKLLRPRECRIRAYRCNVVLCGSLGVSRETSAERMERQIGVIIQVHGGIVLVGGARVTAGSDGTGWGRDAGGLAGKILRRQTD